MKLPLARSAWAVVVCTLGLGFVHPNVAQEDALRKFFRENNRLILVNPFPESLPMGAIFIRKEGEFREVDRDCFLPYQGQVVPLQSYDFVAKSWNKKRRITVDFLKHLGYMALAGSEKVSISVLEGKSSKMPESRFRKIIDDPDFPTGCSELIWDKHNYILYEVVTGKLSFTFWKKIKGQWQINKVPFLPTVQRMKTEAEKKGIESETENNNQLAALWSTTQEGGIQMKESRVLAVHVRRWKRGSRGRFDEPMSFFQFTAIWNLDWKLVQPHQ